MSPPQEKEQAIWETIPIQNQIDIKKLASEGYYLEFPEKTVCISLTGRTKILTFFINIIVP